MELRRSRRIQGLPPVKEEESPIKGLEGIVRTSYEWAAIVLIAVILPIVYFTAFK